MSNSDGKPDMVIIDDSAGVYWNFTRACHTCGETVQVMGGQEQPHECTPGKPLADERDPVVKYDGNGQPVRASDLSLGNRAERRAAAREARRRR